jgi:hypothetical protein
LSVARYGLAGANSPTHAYFAGGSTTISSVEKFNFSNDSRTITTSLSVARKELAGASQPASAVQEITITNPSKTSSSLYLTWDTTADYFKVLYKKSSDVNFSTINNLTDNFYNLTNLQSLSNYDIIVEGYNSSDEKISEGLNQFSTDSAPIISDNEFIVMRVKSGFIVKLNLPHTVLTPNVSVAVKYKKSIDSEFIQLPSRKVAPNDKIYLYGLNPYEDYDIEIEY